MTSTEPGKPPERLLFGCAIALSLYSVTFSCAFSMCICVRVVFPSFCFGSLCFCSVSVLCSNFVSKVSEFTNDICEREFSPYCNCQMRALSHSLFPVASFTLCFIRPQRKLARPATSACVGRLPVKSGHTVCAGFPVQHSGCADFFAFSLLLFVIASSPFRCWCRFVAFSPPSFASFASLHFGGTMATLLRLAASV